MGKAGVKRGMKKKSKKTKSKLTVRGRVFVRDTMQKGDTFNAPWVNDLGIANRMIQSEPNMPGLELTPKEKVEDLIRFSVSESYFRLREALGIQIQVS